MEKNMQIVLGIILSAVLLALVIVGIIWKRRVFADEYSRFAEKEDSYTLVVQAYDWGPAVPKIIVNVGEIESRWQKENIVPENFSVTVSGDSFDWSRKQHFIDIQKREITAVYPCDIDGNKIDDIENATHLAFEFAVHPDDAFFSPFFYDPKKQVNVWKENYAYSISSKLLTGNIVTENDMVCAPTALFKTVKVQKGSRLHAAYFEPKNKTSGKKLPLIIWLNGAGEGGKDVSIALLGNKVTSLAGEKIQSYFGGAYVLCVQTPTVWMNATGTPYDILSPECTNKSSQYTAECKQVIDDFIKTHSTVDINRIYVGGCSNGGYMTMNLLLTYPGFFAAAYPTCEAYEDNWLTDEQIAALSKSSIWFTAAKDDTTVPPEKNAAATVQRLLAAGARDVHFSYFDDVHDTSGSYSKKNGKPYVYNGHWSWIYVLNDECTDEKGTSLWKWMANHSTADDTVF